MKGLAGLSRTLYASRSSREGGAGTERDDDSLARNMRALAVRLRVNGPARLCGAGIASGGQNSKAWAGRRRRYLPKAPPPTPALERLAQDARIMEACAAQAHLDGGAHLRAADGVPRVLRRCAKRWPAADAP